MHDDQLHDIVLDALAASGLPPNLLVIELTESVLVQDAERMVRRLRKLRSRGVRIALDDFGTGHSSLFYLNRFPFDLIKLDKTLIDPLGSDNGLCAGVLQLTRTLGLTTIAEGVERHEQARQLSALNCDLVQGYLYSPPLPAAQIDDLLRSPGLAPQYTQLGSR
jgi:EAL domain-containing protein (putative c-di-GMP-specific phosphodiesterase class I)